jgi:hypothetical protein
MDRRPVAPHVGGRRLRARHACHPGGERVKSDRGPIGGVLDDERVRRGELPAPHAVNDDSDVTAAVDLERRIGPGEQRAVDGMLGDGRETAGVKHGHSDVREGKLRVLQRRQVRAAACTAGVGREVVHVAVDIGRFCRAIVDRVDPQLIAFTGSLMCSGKCINEPASSTGANDPTLARCQAMWRGGLQ